MDSLACKANYSAAARIRVPNSDVIQRTEGGEFPNTSRTTPRGESHTRSVDVSCDEHASNRVEQVDVGQQP
jgi:hypothetical protein